MPTSDPLQQALVEQEMGKPAPTPPPPPIDPVVQRALSLLPAYDKPVSFEMLSPKGKMRPTGTEAVAWVDTTKPGTISMPNWTDTYQRASKGEMPALQKLAGAIAHERFHLSHGPDEGPAYDEQIAMLVKLGAPKDVIEKAQKAKAYIASQGIKD